LHGFEYDKPTLDIPRDQNYDLMVKLRQGKLFDAEAAISTAQHRFHASDMDPDNRDF
jgi:hypothetical protein